MEGGSDGCDEAAMDGEKQRWMKTAMDEDSDGWREAAMDVMKTAMDG
jgi:hypothetical protein